MKTLTSTPYLSDSNFDKTVLNKKWRSSNFDALTWSAKGIERIIYATPQWDEENKVPFEISNPEINKEIGNDFLGNLVFNEKQTITDQLDLYMETLSMITKCIEKGESNFNIAKKFAKLKHVEIPACSILNNGKETVVKTWSSKKK